MDRTEVDEFVSPPNQIVMHYDKPSSSSFLDSLKLQLAALKDTVIPTLSR